MGYCVPYGDIESSSGDAAISHDTAQRFGEEQCVQAEDHSGNYKKEPEYSSRILCGSDSVQKNPIGIQAGKTHLHPKA